MTTLLKLAERPEIAQLESTMTLRRIREGGAWLTDLDAQIVALRGKL